MRVAINRHVPPPASHAPRPRHAAVLLLALAIQAWPGAARARQHAASVAVLDLEFKGEISSGVRTALSRKLREGLGATGMRVVPDQRLRQVLPPGPGSCGDSACWRLTAGRLGCRFLAGGAVVGEDRSYTIDLFLADGYSGEVAARVQRRCDICGLLAVGEAMDLMASALSAKVQAIQARPGRISVQTTPSGATVRVDGDPVGTSPLEIDLPAGDHKITAEVQGFLGASRVVTAVAGVDERMTLTLIPAESPRSPWRVLGWSAVGTGVVSVGVAALLFVLDGGQASCGDQESVLGGQCPGLRETSAGAWATATVGAAAVATGLYLLLR